MKTPDSKYREIADLISSAVFSAGKAQKVILAERIENALKLAAQDAREEAIGDCLRTILGQYECYHSQIEGSDIEELTKLEFAMGAMKYLSKNVKALAKSDKPDPTK